MAALCGMFVFNVVRHMWLHHGTGLSFAVWSHDPYVQLGYVAFPLLLLALFAVSGFYNEPVYKSRYDGLTNTALMSIIGALAVYFVVMVNDNLSGRTLHYGLLAVLVVSFFLPVFFERLLVHASLRRRIMRGELPYNIMVVGASASAVELAARLEEGNKRMGYRVVGYVDDGSCSTRPDDRPVVSFDMLGAEIDRCGVMALVVVPSGLSLKDSVEEINRLYAFGVTILVPPDLYNLITSRPRLTNIIGEPLVDITGTGMGPAAANLKRLGDIAVSIVAMIVLSPVYVIIAAAVKLNSHGPVFYRQMRIGYHKREFSIIKFRSMVVEAEPDGPALSSSGDKRITKVGRVLRKYRLDELPQFWNVLKGDMSLVGPRPERAYFLEKLTEHEPCACMLHKVRPGLTSLGTVKFGYAGSVDAMVKRLYYDMLYLENMSLSMDLKIMFHTINTIITGKGV